MTKSLEALKPEMARESGSILIIAAARLVRMEALRPLHALSELGQKTIGTRAMRDAIDCVEESLLREAGKIRDGHDMLARKLREAESRIAELEALCVKPADAMREVAPLCVKLPEDFPDDAELLLEIDFLDDESTDIKTAQWLKELRRRRAAGGTVEGSD